MEPVNFDSLFSAAEERQRWESSPAQRRRGGTSQGSAGSTTDLHPGTLPVSDASSPAAQRRRRGASQGASDQNPGTAPGPSNFQQSHSLPVGDLRQQAIANNLSNRLSPSKKAPAVRSLRPDSTPQLSRRRGTTSPACGAGLRRSSSMRDCTEWTRMQNKQKVILINRHLSP